MRTNMGYELRIHIPRGVEGEDLATLLESLRVKHGRFIPVYTLVNEDGEEYEQISFEGVG